MIQSIAIFSPLYISPNKFICNSCNKLFNTKSHLTQHKNKKNPCFVQLYSNINNNLIELNNQHKNIETDEIINMSLHLFSFQTPIFIMI